MRTDVSSEEDVARLINLAVERYGGLHCAVNNAGIDLNAGITDATEEQFDKLVSTNLRGVWLCLRHELRHMRGAGGGAIVNVNSVSGARPTDAQAIYGMTKRGVTHLTQSAAREAGKDGVRVNEILPALLMTEMVRDYFEGPHAIPLEPVVARLALPRAGEPEDGATRSSSSAPTRRATSPAPACPSTAASCSTTPARRDRGPPPEQWQPSRTYSAATPLQESLSTSGFNAGSPPV